MTFLGDERTDTSAVEAMERATPPRPPKRGPFMVVLSDESGPLDSFWTPNATDLVGIARAMLLKHDLSTVLTAAWGPNPMGPAFGSAFVITIPGTHEVKARTKRERKPKRTTSDWDPSELDAGPAQPAYRSRFFAPSSSVPVPVDASTETVVSCCGIGHTAASFRALEMINVTERTQGDVVIHAEARVCSCCKATLSVTTTRLKGSTR
jgi:hypothetical protein